MGYDSSREPKEATEKREQGTSMEPEQRRAAKQQMLELMETGISWQEAATSAGIQSLVHTSMSLIWTATIAAERGNGTSPSYEPSKSSSRMVPTHAPACSRP